MVLEKSLNLILTNGQEPCNKPNKCVSYYSLALVLDPWLSLRTKLQSLVLSLALRVESLVLTLALKVYR